VCAVASETVQLCQLNIQLPPCTSMKHHGLEVIMLAPVFYREVEVILVAAASDCGKN
jgi:hypothetical protein